MIQSFEWSLLQGGAGVTGTMGGSRTRTQACVGSHVRTSILARTRGCVGTRGRTFARAHAYTDALAWCSSSQPCCIPPAGAERQRGGG